MTLVTVARVSDVSPGEARVVEVGGRIIGLFHRDDGWYAVDNTCPHRGGSLADGDVDGFVVTCPLHASQFDIRTGGLISPPAMTPVRAYVVVLQGEEVQVDLP